MSDVYSRFLPARWGRMWAVIIPAILVGLVLLFGSKSRPSTVSAPSDVAFRDVERFQCVSDVGPVINATDKPFEPGLYLTVIDVYNFNDFAVQFSTRAVLARSLSSPLRNNLPGSSGKPTA
jgi:hypothetical protein